jgi:hypothetical protein
MGLSCLDRKLSIKEVTDREMHDEISTYQKKYLCDIKINIIQNTKRIFTGSISSV